MNRSNSPKVVTPAFRSLWLQLLWLVVAAGFLPTGCGGSDPLACEETDTTCGGVLKPDITSVSPAHTVAGSATFTLTVDGSNFDKFSEVNWNGAQRNTTFVSPTRLTAIIGFLDIDTAGTAKVTVFNSIPGSSTTKTSNEVVFTIDPATIGPSAGFVTVIRVDNDGAFADNSGGEVALSADGRFAPFESSARNLVSSPTVTQSANVYVHDSCMTNACTKPTTQLASARRGLAGNGGFDGNAQTVAPPSICADGRFVAFVSYATNLAGPVSAQHAQAYVRDTNPCTPTGDVCAPTTTMVSVTSTGAEPSDDTFEAAMSANGRYVAFVSNAADVVPKVTQRLQVYMRDTCQGAPSSQACRPSTVLVSADSSGNVSNSGASGVAMSASGRFVSFSSPASNLPGAAGNGSSQVYVRDMQIGETKLVSTGADGKASVNADYGVTAISDNGRVVAFVSTGALAPASIANNFNLFVHDTCETEDGLVPGCMESTSGTGRFVVFQSSATNLVAGGTRPSGVFVRDTCIGADPGCVAKTVVVSLDASGTFIEGVSPVISADGHFCAFLVNASVLRAPAAQAVLARTGF